MQFIATFYLMCLVVLKLTINAASMATTIQSVDNGGREVYAVPIPHASLMIRSIATPLNGGDGSFSGDSIPEDDESRKITKRRYSFAVLGGRSWVASKKRGPLFG